jgi:hypothetical protein
MSNKFYKIVSNYLNEENISINPENVEKAISALPNSPAKAGLNAVSKATAEATDTDPIHKNLMDVIDPKNPKKFTDVFKSPSDQLNALKKLAEQGIPIANTNQTPQQQQTQQKQAPQQAQQQAQPSQQQTPQQNKTDQGKYPGANS